MIARRQRPSQGGAVALARFFAKWLFAKAKPDIPIAVAVALVFSGPSVHTLVLCNYCQGPDT